VPYLKRHLDRFIRFSDAASQQIGTHTDHATSSTSLRVQLPTSADNVALPAFAAARRAAAPLLLTAGPLAVQQSTNISRPPGPQQQTLSSGVRRPGGQTDGRTDGRLPVA